jgi:adenylate cyclase
MLWFADGPTALAAACSILAAVEDERDRGQFPLAVRMGLHVGEVIERGDDFVGRTVNIASRVAGLAGPGELLVTEHALGSLDSSANTAAFRPVGPTRVKGVAAPIWLHRLAT